MAVSKMWTRSFMEKTGNLVIFSVQSLPKLWIHEEFKASLNPDEFVEQSINNRFLMLADQIHLHNCQSLLKVLYVSNT